jgi:hypothetical protein
MKQPPKSKFNSKTTTTWSGLMTCMFYLMCMLCLYLTCFYLCVYELFSKRKPTYIQSEGKRFVITYNHRFSTVTELSCSLPEGVYQIYHIIPQRSQMLFHQLDSTLAYSFIRVCCSCCLSVYCSFTCCCCGRQVEQHFLRSEHPLHHPQDLPAGVVPRRRRVAACGRVDHPCVGWEERPGTVGVVLSDGAVIRGQQVLWRLRSSDLQ